MIITDLDKFHRGWFIGDFEPSLLRTKNFEVGILSHKKDEDWPAHYHAQADEYNVLLNGSMVVNNILLEKGDIFVVERNEVSKPRFVTDCTILVVKVPSVIGDKINV